MFAVAKGADSMEQLNEMTLARDLPQLQKCPASFPQTSRVSIRAQERLSDWSDYQSR